MGSILKKAKKNTFVDLTIGIKYVCPNCHNERIIYQDEYNKFKYSKSDLSILFNCEKCNVRIFPSTIEVDY